MTPPSLVLGPYSPRISQSVFSGSISSAASPLQSSFSLSCRSPNRQSHYSNDVGSINAGVADRWRTSSRYLRPPVPVVQGGRIPGPESSWHLEARNNRDDDNNAASDDGYSVNSVWSPTDRTRFLQPGSPGLTEEHGELGQSEGKLGVISAINIITGKTLGVGVYSVPSAIFSGAGSVGMTLLLWVLGSLISFCGLAVYLPLKLTLDGQDLGTAMPRSGGERVYLERIFNKPYMLATCMFMAYIVLLGFSTPNAIVLGEHALYALGIEENRWNVRAIAVAMVSSICYLHSKRPKLGLQLINILGVVKMLILVTVILSGVAGGLMGVGSDRQALRARRPDPSFPGMAPRSTAQRNFSDIWAGSSTQPYDYATALLKVIYCFRGYSTANQVLSDVKNPVRTLKIAAPVALSLISVAYLTVNVAFFLVVEKDEFKSAGVVVAAVFFRNVFGPDIGAHVLPFFVIISAASNIAATSFAQARVNEELARDGLLPWSDFWSSSPREISRSQLTSPELMSPSASNFSKAAETSLSLCANTADTFDDFHNCNMPLESSGYCFKPSSIPSRGLLLHWLISVLAIVLPPPGRIYIFLINIGGYPVSVISVALSVGLLYLHGALPSQRPAAHWATPFRCPNLAVVVFGASNCLLLILPWIPPNRHWGGGDNTEVDGELRFAWFAYPATALAVLSFGGLWWVWWTFWGRGSENRRSSGKDVKGTVEARSKTWRCLDRLSRFWRSEQDRRSGGARSSLLAGFHLANDNTEENEAEAIHMTGL